MCSRGGILRLCPQIEPIARGFQYKHKTFREKLRFVAKMGIISEKFQNIFLFNIIFWPKIGLHVL